MEITQGTATTGPATVDPFRLLNRSDNIAHRSVRSLVVFNVWRMMQRDKVIADKHSDGCWNDVEFHWFSVDYLAIHGEPHGRVRIEFPMTDLSVDDLLGLQVVSEYRVSNNFDHVHDGAATDQNDIHQSIRADANDVNRQTSGVADQLNRFMDVRHAIRHCSAVLTQAAIIQLQVSETTL